MSNDWPADMKKLSPIEVTRNVVGLGRCNGRDTEEDELRLRLHRCTETAWATASWAVGEREITVQYCERHAEKLIKLHEGLGARRVIVVEKVEDE